MLINEFKLHHPKTLKEAVQLNGELANARILAGGTFLLNTLKILKKKVLKTPENINSVLLNYEDYIKDETLTEKILSGEGKEFEFLKTEINGDPCEIYIQKAI
jgi:hypothetical protein